MVLLQKTGVEVQYFVPVSAKTGEGINELLEMISLTAEVLELKGKCKEKSKRSCYRGEA